jgi:hypothetical protein
MKPVSCSASPCLASSVPLSAWRLHRLIWGVPKATAPIEASPLDDDFEDDEDDDDDFEAKLIRDPDAWRDR